MKWLQIVLAGLTLGLVVGFVAWDTDARLSPGPLHPSHAAVAELQGTEGCAACHDRSGSMTVACAVCHETVAAQSGTGRGLHGALPPETLSRCGNCHSEHHGDQVPLVAAHAFERADVPDRDRYDHRHVPSYPLNGAHDSLACESCHAQANATVLPVGSARFLGLDSACASCHHDPHAGAFGSTCTECHDQESAFNPPARFVHGRFPLHEAHARTACAQCHPDVGPHAISSLQAENDAPARRCADCHEDPHDSVTAASAPRFAIGDGSCTDCHGDSSFHSTTISARDHARFGVELAGAHVDLECATCHSDDSAPTRAAGDCAACHESPHGESFLGRAAARGAARCAACHSARDVTFANPSSGFSASMHADVATFTLAPPHADLECAACHESSASTYDERFPGRAAGDCAACHRDPHRGVFDDGSTRGRCVTCHARDRFSPSEFGIDAHARTAFPLDGAHGAVPCSACHERVTPGEPPPFAGTPTACAGCHADPHRGRFDSEGLPPTLDGRASCARCHQTRGFGDLHQGSFDHARWTGVALHGAHGKASCTDCHGRHARPDAEGRTLGSAPTACAQCHADPHGGQFASDTEPAGDCERCHSPVASFSDITFDHARDARFTLDERHEKLDCGTCHRSEAATDGVVRVRYRPIGTACTDCHGPMPRPGGRR